MDVLFIQPFKYVSNIYTIYTNSTIEGYRSSTMGSFHHILFLSLSHSFFLQGNVEAQKQGGDPNPEAVDRECDTRFAMLRCGSGAVKQPFVDQPFVVQFYLLQVIISILILIILRYILFSVMFCKSNSNFLLE